MRQIICIVLVLFSFMAFGCSRKTVVNTPEGKVDVTQHGDKMVMETKEGKVEMTGKGETVTVETGEGKAVIGKSAEIPKDLGVPVYPGVTVEGSVTSSGSAEGDKKVATVILRSKDSFDKVFDFYKEHLSASAKATTLSSQDTKVGMFEMEENGKQIHLSVALDAKSGSVLITIVKEEKGEGK